MHRDRDRPRGVLIPVARSIELPNFRHGAACGTGTVFRVWAPAARHMQVKLASGPVMEMTREGGGYCAPRLIACLRARITASKSTRRSVRILHPDFSPLASTVVCRLDPGDFIPRDAVSLHDGRY